MNGSIAGRVVDARGDPVAGASAAISHSTQPVADIAAITDANGRFRLGNLLPGQYGVEVRSALSGAAEATVEVASGQEVEIELRFDGQPAPSVLDVTLQPENIDWDSVSLARVSLQYEDPQHGIDVSKDVLFGPTSSAPRRWTVELKDPDRRQYTCTIAYFLEGGVQKTVGPKRMYTQQVVLGLGGRG